LIKRALSGILIARAAGVRDNNRHDFRDRGVPNSRLDADL